MENASKALIIAGAILLSILIIALGIYVFNMAKGATNTNSLDELEVSQFNQPFTTYRGKKLGSAVVDLLDKVIANATTNAGSDDRLPDIIYVDTRAAGALTSVTGKSTKNAAHETAVQTQGLQKAKIQFAIVSDSTNAKIPSISELRSKIADKHYYQIAFDNDNTTGLIKYIIIQY